MRDINLVEERDFAELRRISQRLRVPYPEAFLKLEVTYKGRTRIAYNGRSHSWVRNAYNQMFSQMACKDLDDTTFGAGKLSMKDTGGTVRYGAPAFVGSVGVSGTNCVSIDAYVTNYTGLINTANATYGIVVGSGTDAESFEDIALGTQIANGTAAGQLSHAASDVTTVAYVAGTKTETATLIRYFNNNSGGNVDVNEVGIYIKAHVVLGDAAYIFCTSRDKLSSTVTIANTGQLKVSYAISLVYPS